MDYFKTNQTFAPTIQKETPTTRYIYPSQTNPPLYSFEEIGEFTCRFNFNTTNTVNNEITNSDEEGNFYFAEEFANKRFKNENCCAGSPITAPTTNTAANTNENNTDSGNDEIFEQVGKKRARCDAENNGNNRMKVCKACKLYQTQIKKRSGMCTICNKVYKFAQEIVEKNNGAMFTFNEETRDFTIICGFNHTFTAPFDMKQLKYWCNRCTRSERDTRKAYFREADAQKRREMSEMQEKLIMQANAVAGCGGGTNNNCNNTMTEDEETTNEDNESDKCYFNNYDNEEYCQDKYGFKEAFNEGRNQDNNEEDKGDNNGGAAATEINIGQFIRGIGGNIARTNRMTEAEFMEYIVELIIKAPQRRIEQFFENMPKGERVRMFRRLARFVHPDKNANRFAKEAF